MMHINDQFAPSDYWPEMLVTARDCGSELAFVLKREHVDPGSALAVNIEGLRLEMWRETKKRQVA